MYYYVGGNSHYLSTKCEPQRWEGDGTGGHLGVGVGTPLCNRAQGDAFEKSVVDGWTGLTAALLDGKRVNCSSSFCISKRDFALFESALSMALGKNTPPHFTGVGSES